MSKIAIRVSSDIHAQVKEYAEQHDIDIVTATERLLTTAFGRIAALTKYAEQRGAAPKRAPKAPAKKKAPAKTKANGKKAPKKAPAKKRIKKQDMAQTGIVPGAVLP